jgi:hypothetical protein
MAFEDGGEVFQLKFLRDMYHPLPVKRLEEVTAKMLGLSDPVRSEPIRTSKLTNPVDIYNQAVKKLLAPA